MLPKNKTGAAPITDVVRSDYYSLGKGRLPQKAVTVEAKCFRRAEEKRRVLAEAVSSTSKPHRRKFIKCSQVLFFGGGDPKFYQDGAS